MAIFDWDDSTVYQWSVRPDPSKAGTTVLGAFFLLPFMLGLVYVFYALAWACTKVVSPSIVFWVVAGIAGLFVLLVVGVIAEMVFTRSAPPDTRQVLEGCALFLTIPAFYLLAAEGSPLHEWFVIPEKAGLKEWSFLLLDNALHVVMFDVSETMGWRFSAIQPANWLGCSCILVFRIMIAMSVVAMLFRILSAFFSGHVFFGTVSDCYGQCTLFEFDGMHLEREHQIEQAYEPLKVGARVLAKELLTRFFSRGKHADGELGLDAVMTDETVYQWHLANGSRKSSLLSWSGVFVWTISVPVAVFVALLGIERVVPDQSAVVAMGLLVACGVLGIVFMIGRALSSPPVAMMTKYLGLWIPILGVPALTYLLMASNICLKDDGSAYGVAEWGLYAFDNLVRGLFFDAAEIFNVQFSSISPRTLNERLVTLVIRHAMAFGLIGMLIHTWTMTFRGEDFCATTKQAIWICMFLPSWYGVELERKGKRVESPVRPVDVNAFLAFFKKEADRQRSPKPDDKSSSTIGQDEGVGRQDGDETEG